MKQGGAVTPTAHYGREVERAMEKRQCAEEDVSHAPISILATRQSRIELATTAVISTLWNCNGLF